MQHAQVNRGARLSAQNASTFFHGPLDNLDELEKGDVSQIRREPVPAGGASVRFDPATDHERTYYVREIVRGGFEHRC
jgi:hypothetical protein